MDDPIGLAADLREILPEDLSVREILRVLRPDLFQKHLVIDGPDVPARPQRDFRMGHQLQVFVHQSHEPLALPLFL